MAVGGRCYRNTNAAVAPPLWVSRVEVERRTAYGENGENSKILQRLSVETECFQKRHAVRPKGAGAPVEKGCLEHVTEAAANETRAFDSFIDNQLPVHPGPSLGHSWPAAPSAPIFPVYGQLFYVLRLSHGLFR